jgi:hypothetical protein
MKKTKTGMIALAAGIALSGPAAADSMRCGEPASIERREILRGYGYYHGTTVNTAYEVSVELWTYNFGPHKLMYRLRFEDGLLVDVDTLSHGYNPPAY